MSRLFRWVPMFFMLIAVSSVSAVEGKIPSSLAEQIRADQNFDKVIEKAKSILKTGFTAGDGYGEVWIRDFATFMDIACEVHDQAEIKKNLLLFFSFQGDDGNIIDGFIPTSKAHGGYDYIIKDSIPDYRGHKNTVETDQETSLLHAVHTYIQKTGDRAILQEVIHGKTVLARMEEALNFLLTHRFAKEYGLLWGATTVDWGDVQPEHEWGVVLDENSHLTVDIYDNAMFLLAIENYIALVKEPAKITQWQNVHREIKQKIREHLWDAEKQKFIPHIYLSDSPFPPGFDENKIYYHGGTAVAILAGVLSKEEILVSLAAMRENCKKSGAATIGLTVYPPYPKGYFKNPSMAKEYSYQNGGDWTWFGARMVHGLIQHGFVEEAYVELQPMLQRVVDNDGFFEWYSIDNRPQGSGVYRGSAGVLWKAIRMLREAVDE